MQKLVEIRRFDNPVEAHVLCDLLGDAGIPARVFDEHVGTALPHYGMIGVRVVVRAEDVARAMHELARVTRPGGKVVVLELSEPRGGLMSSIARVHVHHMVPFLGGLLSGRKEYGYLQRSIAAFPPPETFSEMMGAAGLVDVTATPLTMGVAHLFVGTRGEASRS